MDIPVWERYTLSIEEASQYFRIGENKLRKLAEENKHANCSYGTATAFRLSGSSLKNHR